MNDDLISRTMIMDYLREQQANVIMEKNKNGFVPVDVCDGAESAISAFMNFVLQMPTAGEVEKRWILSSKRLPDEPEEIPTEDEPIEEMVLDGKFKEYIVQIWGVDEATALYYAGKNEWYDCASGESYYKVIAWQPMPKIL